MRNLRTPVQPQAKAAHVLRAVPDRTEAACEGGMVGAACAAGQGPSQIRPVVPVAQRWEISDHAITRYTQRVMRGRSVARARGDLIWMLERAHFVKRLPGGIELWRGPKPLRLRLRVDGRTLMTVIEDCDARRTRD